MVSPPEQLSALAEERVAPRPVTLEKSDDFDGSAQARELRMWVRAIRSFFILRNHPALETAHAELIAHDWMHDLRVLHGTLLRCSQLVLHLINLEKADKTIFDESETESAFQEFTAATLAEDAEAEPKDDSLHAMAAGLVNASQLCQSLFEAKQMNLRSWMLLEDEFLQIFDRFKTSKTLSSIAAAHSSSKIPAPLLSVTQKRFKPDALGADMRAIFSSIFDLLDHLKYVENFLRQDQALKQALPIFTLVHEDGRLLAGFIKTRALRTVGLEQHIAETLDSINYAITMELRKVFAHELVGVSSLRQAPAIYIKVENAHGLLRDSFRQSAIGLAQLFDPSIEGSQLFDAYQTKFEQSLALRRDLWTLLQLVRRAEKEPNSDSIRRLLDSLASFHEGSLRYLMFKDWDSCERFMEEVGAAREAAELVPVLHRFAAYLEALSNQVNMRAVLVNHPFDYPELEDA
ncbi:MAG TPA: hypothetical protein VF791_02780 [Pyrinomonadaceae bacterium]